MATPTSTQESIKQWGLPKTLYGSLVRLLSHWVVICSLHSRPLIEMKDDGDLPDEVSIRIATQEELRLACKEMPNELSLDFITNALARGDVCVGAFAGQYLVAFVWRSYSTAPHVNGIWVSIDKPYRYTYKAYTRPDYRGRGLNKNVIDYKNKISIDQGYTHGIGFIRVDNFKSLTAARKLQGHEVVGFAGYFQLFGRVIPFRSKGAKKSNFRFY